MFAAQLATLVMAPLCEAKLDGAEQIGAVTDSARQNGAVKKYNVTTLPRYTSAPTVHESCMNLMEIDYMITRYRPKENADVESVKQVVKNLSSCLAHYMIKEAVQILSISHDNLYNNIPDCKARPPVLELTTVQKSIVVRIAVWRIAQKWYGPLSKRTLTVASKAQQYLSECDPKTFDSPILALCYAEVCKSENCGEGASNEEVFKIPGRAKFFAPPWMRNFLTTSSPLLDDFVAVYAIMASTRSYHILKMASKRVRSNFQFCQFLVYKVGDDMLHVIDDSVYATARSSLQMLCARKLHYKNSSTNPKLRVVRQGSRVVALKGVKLVDEEDWLLP